ncbi:MAG: T9SS type A sorting domain-containing protein, partial [Ignavibacteriaceae bacterium]|nr:T9SS type A sorting domain-containing protein [Ignavibacteriaceae bacterium]
NAVHMLNDATNGYSGGDGGWVYTTFDGESWNVLASMGTLLDLSFPPGTSASNPVGYACGDNGQVWEITSTLQNLNSPSSSTLSGISAPSVNNVWVCGGGSIFYYNGSTFAGQTSPGGTFNDIHFINNQEGWVVGNQGVIGRTTDGGANWVTQTNPDTQNRSLYGVFFLGTDNGWAVGFNGVILHTTNGGTTWTIEGAGLTTAFLNGVHFTSTSNGYVVGNGKTLIKFGELTSVDGENISPGAFSLSQNYPNPFNPITKIKFTIPTSPLNPSPYQGEGNRERFVTLKVYDVLGMEVATLVNEEKPAGEYEIEFDANELTSGIYFYQIKAGNFIETKKMVLMK